MTTVASLLGMSIKQGDLGIEIETEAARAYDVPRIQGWVSKSDGSLRDFGIEYISNGPVTIGNLRSHLETWQTGLGSLHKSLKTDSVSTSVHVHVNIQELTPLQVLNFYLVGVLFEDVMSVYAGEDRRGNLFCLRTSDAESHFNQVRRSVSRASSEADLVRSFNPQGEQKIYANVHTIPIMTLGTIEFRIMRGVTDIDPMEIWARTIYNLREFSKRFATPVDLLAYLKATGPRQVMAEAFGRDFDHFNFPDAEMMLVKSYYYIMDMATSRKKWDNISESKPKAPKIAPTAAPRAGRAEDGRVIVWDDDFEEEDL